MPHPSFDDVHPVVLAGGSGTRLWPLSRIGRPKHLAPLLGERSLLRHTVERLLTLVPADRIMTVGAAAQAELLARELEHIDADLLSGLLLEPVARNTAAAVGLAAAVVAGRLGGERVLWVCPSDHLIQRPDVLREAVVTALPAVREGALATFGIRPSRPETGFGYIRLGPPLAGGKGVHRVAAFVEKPPREQAQAMLQTGDWLWNSGIFLFRADSLLAELGRFAPAIGEAVQAAARAVRSGSLPRPPSDLYARIPEQPIDKAVMERSQRLVVVPCDPGWSDLGSWQALWEIADRDDQANAFSGEVTAEAVRGCLVHASTRLVALAGVEDLVLVDTPDALFVGRRDGSEPLKRLVARLAKEIRPEVLEPFAHTAPWGEERLVARLDGLELRVLRLVPDAPAYPAEDPNVVWTVVEGEVERSRDGQALRAGRGEGFLGERGLWLRCAGRGDARLVKICPTPTSSLE